MYTPKTKKLLTSNAKLAKGDKFTILGLDLAPGNISGKETCPHRGACFNVCIGMYSGFHVMDSVRQAQINRTNWFFEDRKGFLKQLHKELKALEKKPNPACRLNVDSDLNWPTIDRTLFNYNITFYDYTKSINRAYQSIFSEDWPSNYHLTYSWNESSSKYKRKINKMLNAGGRINVVWHHRYRYNDIQRNQLPATFKIATKTHEVVDGDVHDARLEEGKVVMVRAKLAKAKIPEYVNKGFIVGRSAV